MKTLKKELIKNNYSKSADIHKILGDETRIKILWLLMDKDMYVGEIAENILMTPSSISHQLRNLKAGKLVKSSRKGKKIIYSIKDENTKIMLRYISESVWGLTKEF